MKPKQISNNILLIGFMGSGKSSIGRQLALNQKRRFVDTDKEITDAYQLTISAIFSQQGEEGFRNLESNILRCLADQHGIILATGGGIILREENRILLRKMGIIVWLDATADTLFKRAICSQVRPLLYGESSWERFNSLLAFRKRLYHEIADLYIDSSNLNQAQTILKIIDAIADWQQVHSHSDYSLTSSMRRDVLPAYINSSHQD